MKKERFIIAIDNKANENDKNFHFYDLEATELADAMLEAEKCWTEKAWCISLYQGTGKDYRYCKGIKGHDFVEVMVKYERSWEDKRNSNKWFVVRQDWGDNKIAYSVESR